MSTLISKVVKTKRHRMNVNIERYESALNVVADCRMRQRTDSSFKNMEKLKMSEWEGVESYEEALDLLRNGYQPTVESLRNEIRTNAKGLSKRIQFQNNVYGFAPVVPLALNGVPNSMINMTMKPIKTKVIDVYYDMTTSCGTDSDRIIKNGQKLLGAIIGLEKQGYRFNLYAMQTYTDSSSADILVVKVKSSNQPIDLKRISFPLTHTAFFRVIGFDWYSKTPKGKYRCGYGHAIRFEIDGDESKEFVKQTFGDNAIFLSGKEIQYNSEEHIKEVLTNDKSNN